jgi:uncharacterized membrane protein
MKTGNRILLPILFTYLLLSARIIITGQLDYIFLAWNLFLAWLPLAFSTELNVQNSRWKNILFAAAWLLFLPNAPYIITDFLHLRHRSPVPYWFDILLLFSAAVNGLLLFLLSVQRVDRFLEIKYGNRKAAGLVFSAFFLCAFGIYIGRYLRWNSWDILTSPADLVNDIVERVVNPFEHFNTWSVTFAFGVFLLVIYYSLKNNFIIKTKSI